MVRLKLRKCNIKIVSFQRSTKLLCPYNNLKTIADICFLLGSYVGSRKVSHELACEDHRSGRGYFSDGSRLLGKVRL